MDYKKRWLPRSIVSNLDSALFRFLRQTVEMDALTIATTIVQFIDFTSKIVSKTAHIHLSSDGRLEEHREIEAITGAISRDAQSIQQCIDKRRKAGELTDAEKEQEKIGEDCQEVAEELLSVLRRLQTSGRPSQWRSFRQALRTMWREDKIQSLERRLDRFRQQMIAIILDSLRLQAEKSSQQQSCILETVTEMRQLQRDTQSVGRAFLKHVKDGERWRRDLIQAIHETKSKPQNRRPNPASSVGPNSGEVAAQIQKLVLRSLRFREMADREFRIPKAHEETFKWIFSDEGSLSQPLASFKNFLEQKDCQLYWITGKPGSGKSTLMKYLRHNQDTFDCLRVWSGGENVVSAHFYFWNSGSDMQMTVEGLLQTLLYEFLRQLPSLIRDAFPERWEVFRLIGEDDYPWRWEELSTALRKLVLDVGRGKSFFMMIDGLDECAGDQSQLTDLTLDLVNSATNLKACVASRPWTNFEDSFKGRPHLKLEDLTLDDINKFVTSKFEASEGFHELRDREPEYAERLLREISDKAQGVFLWVHLVVSSLLSGLANGDRMRDLQRRLDDLPPRLEDLFEKMLDGLEDGYLTHASQLFQLVRASRTSPTLLGLALADLDEREHALRAQVRALTKEQKLVHCKNMKRKLMSRCRGLLEATAHTSADKATVDEKPCQMGDGGLEPLWATEAFEAQLELDEKKKECGNCRNSDFELKVQYLHRTVKDYIEDPKVWDWIVSANTEPFDPHSRWCESYLAQIKGLDPECLTTGAFWDNVTWCIDYAKETEKTSKRAETRLLDELNLACTSLFETPLQDGSGRTVIRKLIRFNEEDDRADVHWTASFINWIPQPSFIYLMAMCGMHRYLESRLRPNHNPRPGIHQRSDGEDDEDDEEEQASPLFAATDDFLALQRFEKRHSLIRQTPSIQTVRVLLRKGEDPHKLFRGRSPWTMSQGMAERHESIYADITKLYCKYGGPPPVRDADELQRNRPRRNDPDTNPLTPENLSNVPSEVPASSVPKGSVLATYGDGVPDATKPIIYKVVDKDRARPASRDSSGHSHDRASWRTISASADTLTSSLPRRRRVVAPPPPPPPWRAARYPGYAPPPSPLPGAFQPAACPAQFAPPPPYLQQPYPFGVGYPDPHNGMGYRHSVGDFYTWRRPWEYYNNWI